MSAPTITINGVDKTSKVYFPDDVSEISGTIMAGQRASGKFKVYALDGATGYRPAIDDTFLITVGGVDIVGGVIDDIEEDPLTDLDGGFIQTVTWSDWWVYLENVSYTKTYAAGTTLKAALQDLVATPLAAFSITLDAAQATGATFASDVTFVKEPVSQILQRFTTLTGWIPRLSPAKVLRMIAPATIACGFSLGDSFSGTLGTVSTKKSRNQNFANYIILTCGPSGVFPVLKTWVQAGGATSWVVDIPAAAGYGPPGAVWVDDGVAPFSATVHTSPGAEFQWNQNTGTLSVGTLGTPANGVKLTVSYWGQFPFERVYDASPAPDKRRELRVDEPSITNWDEAYTTAQAYARGSAALPLQVTVRENAGFAYPGLYVPLSYTQRAVLGNFLIAAAEFATAEDGSVEYTLTCLDGSELVSTWLDFYVGGGGGTAPVTGSVVSTPSTVLSSPVHLGGSDRTFIAKAPAAWVRVPNAVPYVAPASFTARMRVMACVRNGGGSVNVITRIYDDTAAAAVSGLQTAAVTSSTPTEVTATGDLVGGHRYFLEMLCNTTNEGVAALGVLESI